MKLTLAARIYAKRRIDSFAVFLFVAKANALHERRGQRGIHTDNFSDRSTVIGAEFERNHQSVILGVPAVDRRTGLHDVVDKCQADQRHVTGDTSHQCQCQSGCTDSDRRRLLPGDQDSPLVGQHHHGRYRRFELRAGPYEGGISVVERCKEIVQR
jgi:hypothetical protein